MPDTAVEDEIKKPPSLLNCEVRPMNDQESHYFIQGGLSVALRITADQEFADQLGFPGKVFYAHLNGRGLKIERALMLFLCTISNSPAKLVLWVWTLHNAKVTGPVTLAYWAEHLFPLGVPTEAAYEKIWDAQKSPKGGNLLDGATVWKL